MRKRFTLLITVTALLIGSSGGKVWGQVGQGYDESLEKHYQHGTGTLPNASVGTGGGQTAPGSITHGKHIIDKGGFSWDNHYGAAESGTVTPTTTPFTQSYGWITIGEKTTDNGNIVGNWSNVPGVSYEAKCDACESRIHAIDAPTAKPSTGDGTGVVENNGAAWNATTYSTPTHIRVTSTGKSSASPWTLNQFYFLDVEWRYNHYTLSGDKSHSHTLAKTYFCCGGGSWVSGGGSCHSGSSGCCGSCVTSHNLAYYSYVNKHGGYVDGIITLTGGSHVQLNGTMQSNGNGKISIGAGTHDDSKATVNLPDVHYTLMNDENLDEASITGDKGGVINWSASYAGYLGVDAVLGIQGNYIPSTNIQTNASGGTLLIGSGTTGQGNMILTTTTIAGDKVGKTFGTPSGYVYTGAPYFNTGSANIGNYGNNNVNFENSNVTFGQPVGTAGWKVFAHTSGANCLDMNFNTYANPLTVAINSTGSFLTDVAQNLAYNINNTFNASSTGHVTLRAGNVTFNIGAHTYAGTGTGVGQGDYLVRAEGTTTGTGINKYCGSGNIVVSNGTAPVYAHNKANTTTSGANLEWNAANDIQTGSQVKFENDYNSNIDWIAGNDILTNDTITFINVSQNATGHTKWTAYRDIVTNSIETPFSADNGVSFTHNGAGLTRWEATTRNINTKNIINFLKTSTSTGTTDWWAGKNIWTEREVAFVNQGTGYTKWRADDGDIETGRAGNSGSAGRVDFLNSNATTTTADITLSAKNNIKTNGYINFENNSKSNVLWVTDVNDIVTNDSVTFMNTNSGNTEWRANANITTNDTVEFTNTNIGNTKWHAVNGNITTNRTTPNGGYPYTDENGFVRFNNSGATGSNTDWWAGQNIRTNNVVTFNNDPVVTNAYIKWWAQTGNIEINDSTVFNQLGSAGTGLPANNGLRNLAPTSTPDHGSLWLYAHQNIFSENNRTANHNSPSGENEEPLLINFAPTNNAPIMLHAKAGSVVLDGVTHIERMSQGGTSATDPTYTTIEAGKDIHLLDTFTLADSSAYADILLHAGQDILTNWEGGRPGTCAPDKTAPVTFEVRHSALTHWVADRDIITKDSVYFKYNATDHEVRDLNLVARGGNIETNRWFNIAYDSDNRILFSAVKDMPAPFDFVYPYSPVGGIVTHGPDAARNTNNGNILFRDSMKITRTNLLNGTTDILAKYNIRTAMVDYVDSLSEGNNTTIESYKGDIFLGYSTEPIICAHPALSAPVNSSNFIDYDTTKFTYTVLNPLHKGLLDIKAGYEDQSNNAREGGGNIYFTHLDKYTTKSTGPGASSTEITIPFSNEYMCENDDYLRDLGNGGTYSASRIHYEHAGIIGGVGACGVDPNYGLYPPMQGLLSNAARDTSLIYFGNNGRLLVDAGTRGNIIINRGTYLNFQDDKGNTEFRTRFGNIDMRYPFNADSLQGSLLFLASSDLPDKLNVTNCKCDEERNNVYLQDFKYNPVVNSGSVFVGADNNIKLQYGGLKTIGTGRDPFFSPNNDNGYPCGVKHHCDADTSENQARDLILNFYQDALNNIISSGGFAAVASDRIDTYKNMIYNGGNGSGMSSVPGYGSLHGDGVAGYGLYFKTQANKKNWNKSDHDVNSTPDPTVGAACDDDDCISGSADAFLHNIARVTFHADARIYAENQKVLLSSPVLETFGNADYNTSLRSGGKTSILLQADSLIYHDSLIIDGPKTQFTTWSGLYRDMPIIRLGHQRFTPPTAEDGGYCAPCYTHPDDPRSRGTKALDTVFVTFRNDASINRLHTLVAEHAVISFLTDSFDHKKGNPTLNAKFYTDTFKIRNHVQMFNTPDRTHDGHFELVSETQMNTKDYAGIYARHLHMEPIAPSCSDFKFSQFWMQDYALDVITSSTFGGFGWLHADVHVENGANLFPGFASLGTDGNCYEQRAGVLKMQDLRLDKGANVKVTVGEADAVNSFAEVYECDQTFESIELGRYADCLIVDSLSIYSSMEIDVAVRSAIYLSEGESRCYPIIQYKSVGDGVVNNLKLKKDKFTSKDHKSIEGTYYLTLDVDTACNVVYLCIATIPGPQIKRGITIPSVSGITTTPSPGKHYVNSGSGFSFKAKFDSQYSREGEQLAVRTGRIIDGKEEIIYGKKNANGEYEYFIPQVRVDIVLTFGPDYVSADDVEGNMVWSHDNMINIRVDKDDIASIYMVTGQIVQQISISEGTTSVPMERGVYIVTLKDGSVHKVIVK